MAVPHQRREAHARLCLRRHRDRSRRCCRLQLRRHGRRPCGCLQSRRLGQGCPSRSSILFGVHGLRVGGRHVSLRLRPDALNLGLHCGQLRGSSQCAGDRLPGGQGLGLGRLPPPPRLRPRVSRLRRCLRRLRLSAYQLGPHRLVGGIPLGDDVHSRPAVTVPRLCLRLVHRVAGHPRRVLRLSSTLGSSLSCGVGGCQGRHVVALHALQQGLSPLGPRQGVRQLPPRVSQLGSHCLRLAVSHVTGVTQGRQLGLRLRQGLCAGCPHRPTLRPCAFHLRRQRRHLRRVSSACSRRSRRRIRSRLRRLGLDQGHSRVALCSLLLPHPLLRRMYQPLHRLRTGRGLAGGRL